MSPVTDQARADGRHRPVMLKEVLDALAPRDGGIYIDGTFGGGGYSRALLDAADCMVVGIDRDPDAIAAGTALAKKFGKRLTLILGRFGDMAALLAAKKVGAVDGIAFDVGVSSMQLDEAGRGFSFRLDGPLDMRMDRAGSSAAEMVNSLGEDALVDIIRGYGEERRARRIARAIVEARKAAPISRTGQLADLVRGVMPRGKGRTGQEIDPATRTFQALRIHVNDELGELGRGLGAAEALLAPGGKLAVVAFHSLEDRIVKEFLQRRAGRAPRGSRHRPETVAPRRPSFRLIHRGALKPSDEEIAANPRARSARLRAAERTLAAAWKETIDHGAMGPG